MKDLVRDYGNLRAVDHLSLEVKQGEILGFLGPNGAGKTTSIRMMCGLLRPTSGEVIIEGLPVDSRDKNQVKSRVGICPQENILWTRLTCFEQLMFSARMYNVPGTLARQRAEELLNRMGLGEKRNRLAATLSGGMKRRMNVILAIMHDPSIIVFDEPEAGLDPQSRVMVRDFIRETARSRTVILTTHNMDEADRVADRVAIIDSGRLLKLDTPGNLKRFIGEGDTLELGVRVPDSEAMKGVVPRLEDIGLDVKTTGEKLVIHGMDLVSKIHSIYQLLDTVQITVSEMQIRENSLEDVFIHLTGKSLRS